MIRSPLPLVGSEFQRGWRGVNHIEGQVGTGLRFGPLFVGSSSVITNILSKESKAADNQLGSLAEQGIRPTISKAQAEGFANSLQAAFDGCGTDTDAIGNVMIQMNNDADIYLLISTYGVRKYDACNWEMDFGDKELSLNAAISDELDGPEKSYINTILKNKGIKFQFT